MAFKMKGMDFGNSPIKQEKGESPSLTLEDEKLLLKMEKDIAERKGVSVEELVDDDEAHEYLSQYRKKLIAKY